MKGLLVRVGIDQSYGGMNAPGWPSQDEPGKWEYLYIPIPETEEALPGLGLKYDSLEAASNKAGSKIPKRLLGTLMHLDPDFRNLTYGDWCPPKKPCRGKPLWELQENDFLAFYAGLEPQNIDTRRPLVYALIGFYRVKETVRALDVPEDRLHENAHTRCKLKRENKDIIVRAVQGESGRLRKAIRIGERNGSGKRYHVIGDLWKEWGGLIVNDGRELTRGDITQSGRTPEFREPKRFLEWFYKHGPVFTPDNGWTVTQNMHKGNRGREP